MSLSIANYPLSIQSSIFFIMKKKLAIFGFILLLLVAYVAKTLNETGFFRTVEPSPTDQIIDSIPLVGAEDITASLDGEFLIISSFDRAKNRTGTAEQGGIYFVDLITKGFEPQLISGNFNKKFHPHGISLIRLDSNLHRLFVINHVDEVNSVEVFNLYNRDSLVHQKTLIDDAMFSPNDILAVGANEFYFTNDKGYSTKWGKIRENYLGKKGGRVMYFDGSTYREVAKDFSYANGINYDSTRNLVFVAASRDFLIKVFERAKNGDLTYIESIPCGTGVDNIELDENANLWVGCHPSLLAYQSYSNEKKDKAPSEIIKINYKNKGDYKVESVFVDDGTYVSGTSTAAVFQNLIFAGTVMDSHFLVIKNETN